jgi:hypothetical protein
VSKTQTETETDRETERHTQRRTPDGQTDIDTRATDTRQRAAVRSLGWHCDAETTTADGRVSGGVASLELIWVAYS